MVDIEEIFKHWSSTATPLYNRVATRVKSKLSQTFKNDLRRYMHENDIFYANNFEHRDTILNAFFDTRELLNQQKFTHHDFDQLDGWLGDGILYEKMDMLVKSLEPGTTVNLGSYFMAMTNANQRGGILRQKGVKLMEMDLALLLLNVARPHWILYVIRPKFKLVSFFNSFNNAIVEEDKQVRQWIAEQVGRAYNANEWVIQQMLSPTQADAEACGVFACMNAYRAFIGRDPCQVYAQEHVKQLHDHVGAVILSVGYIGELQMNGAGPVGTTTLKIEHSLPHNKDPHNFAQTSLPTLQKRTSKLKSPVEMTEEIASDKETTHSKKSQKRDGIASNKGDSGRGRGGRTKRQGRGGRKG